MTIETTASPGTETAAPAATADAGTTNAPTTATVGDTTAAPASVTTDAKAADAGTLLGTATTDKTAVAPADFPADWREKLAGGDAKALEQLKRYGSPADVWTKTRSLEQKLSSGEYKKVAPPPAADAKPEDVAAWRKENGIPEAPDGYKIELPNGMVLGEVDKPLVKSFTETVHGKNWSEKQVNEALNWFYTEQDRVKAERAAADHEYRVKSEVDLRSELGNDYVPSVNSVNNLMAGMPAGAAANFLGGRLADGTKIGDNPGVIKWLSSLSREINPYNTLLPANTGDQGKAANDRLSDIVKLMGDSSSDYWRGPKAEAMQQEYRDLIDARDRMKSRAA